MILISRKYCFLAVNFLMVFCMLLSITDSPLAGTVTKVKFIFILYCLADIVLRRKKPANNIVLAIMFIFIFYTVVWGFILDNSHVRTWNAEHRTVMLMYLFMLFGGVYELIEYKCLDEYLITSGAALALVILVQVITHSSSLSLNPAAVLGGVSGSERMKNAFGFMHVNFAGNACFCALISLHYTKKEISANNLFHSRKKIVLLLSTCFLLYILLCTSCRTALIALGMYAGGRGMCNLFQSDRMTKGSKLLLLAIIIISVLILLPSSFIGGFWDYVWSNSNRSLNVSENLKWVGVIGSKWTGMGYVDNQCFYRDESAGGVGGFGVATSSLDMNYLFIYCSTGILGTALFISMIALTGLGLFLNAGQENATTHIVLYLVLLFYAYWETIMFTYRFWSMIVPTTVLLYASNGEMKNEVYKNRAAPPSYSYYRDVCLLQNKTIKGDDIESAGNRGFYKDTPCQQ